MKKQKPVKLLESKNKFIDKLYKKGITKVEFGWKTFKIITMPGDKIKNENDQLCNGLTDLDRGLIFIDEAMNEPLTREILLHEIIHCILEGFGLDEHHLDQDSFCVKNEHLTIMFTRGMMLFRNLNKDLNKILMG